MHYLDTSAAVKLLAEERETGALLAFLTSTDELLLTSRAGIVELRRVGRRLGAADRADALASTLAVVELDETIERVAIGLDPGLRALDAIHLATALAAGSGLRDFVCYDSKLASAARAHGLSVAAPA
ncbi:MAG: type II toxin-antitoxin system VapC family toxin [Gaiellales bacterium]